MSDLIAITANFQTDTALLAANKYTVGEDIYINILKLIVTNLNAATSFTNATLGTNGVIGKLEEAPDLQVANDRMVIRLTCNADQAAAIKRLLRSTDL